LFKSDELLSGQIASLHNLTFYLWLVRQARTHIAAGDFVSWKNDMVVRLMQRL
jgi:queuine tRNA-ribosyltransferase